MNPQLQRSALSWSAPQNGSRSWGLSCGVSWLWILQRAQPHLQQQRRIRGAYNWNQRRPRAKQGSGEHSGDKPGLCLPFTQSCSKSRVRKQNPFSPPWAICHEAEGGGHLNAIKPSPNPPPTTGRADRGACLPKPAGPRV